MDRLSSLFNILEITRQQPQTGYAIWGGNMRLGNLAEHHYLVAMIAWQLAAQANRQGAQLDVQKVMEFALIHDLGELFGGDISMYYARANSAAREKAKAFEAENHRFLARFFGDEAAHFQALADEIMDAQSDEARIVKIADYLECTHYKHFTGTFMPADIDLIAGKLQRLVEGFDDPAAQQALAAFVARWSAEMRASERSFGETMVATLSQD